MADKKQKQDNTEFRAPIVTFMGHVDHGKTSILDAIRNTNVQGGEYGGITQHIGAYQISHGDRKITFIDTPGHEAFTQMRARGGKAADVVVLVVAADSGVQPQTKEAIVHAKAGGAYMIVAINKIDLPGADVQKVKQQLAQENVMVEDWGGDVICIEVSAKTKDNLDGLLDAITAVSDLLELKATPDAELEAMIIESRIDKKRGIVVTGVLRSGTIELGDKIMASGHMCKVKSLTDDKGTNIKIAEPGMPVVILGFKKLPRVGDLIMQEGSELAELAVDETREEIIGQDTKKVVSIVVKADTLGTLEAVKSSLATLVSSSAGLTFSIKFLLTATGDVTDSDVALAQSGDGIVLGFNVGVSSWIRDMARDLGVVVQSYNTIYDLIDQVEDLLLGTAESEEKKIKGRAKIIKIFKLPSGDKILGCDIEVGKLEVNNRVSFYDKDPVDLEEKDEPLFIAKIKKLKTGKDDADVVKKGSECGVLTKPQFEDVQKEMWIVVL